MATAAVSSSSLQQLLQAFVQQRGADLQQLGQALQSGDLQGAQSAYSALQTLAQNGPLANSNEFDFSRRQQEFTQIGQALQNGNLAGAQRAFNELRSIRSTDPAGADGSQPLPPAAVIEISTEAAAAADAAATTPSAATPASVVTPAGTSVSSPAAATVAAPILSAAAPVSAPAPELVINLSLGNGNSGGIEIDLSLVNPSPSAPASTSAASTSPSGTAATSTTPEIVLNLDASSLAAGSEITIGLGPSANGSEQFSLGIGTQANPSQEQININLAQNTNEQIVLNLLSANSATAAAQSPGALINIAI